MNYCPKCENAFYKNMEYSFCEVHREEYEKWTNDRYIPETECPNCGSEEWEPGTIQMTEPPTYPEAKIYRCSECGIARLEHSRSGRTRFFIRENLFYDKF